MPPSFGAACCEEAAEGAVIPLSVFRAAYRCPDLYLAKRSFVFVARGALDRIGLPMDEKSDEKRESPCGPLRLRSSIARAVTKQHSQNLQNSPLHKVFPHLDQ